MARSGRVRVKTQIEPVGGCRHLIEGAEGLKELKCSDGWVLVTGSDVSATKVVVGKLG